ncbi:MAG TPA: hypothetical protein VNJ01_09245 [Bacteriovoracaceae bacterium]|nr:hypothetical protein [Bacteriovoracaceae bacterium]
MNNTEGQVTSVASRTSVPHRGKEKGLYNSITVTRPLDEVISICKDPTNVEKVLSDLPEGIENFFDLTLVSTSDDQLRWENKPKSKVKGTLIMDFASRPAGRGTIITSSAVLSNFALKKEESSDLMYVFLKRFKALIETGELASTKGQPSGRDELKASDKKNLH